MKPLTLAAAQIVCQDGKVLENLSRSSQMAENTKNQGALLVLFPEFLPQGYLLTSALWDSAEPFDGPTVQWLRETSHRLGIYIGTSFLEARNGHFYNTFALAEPGGKIAGVVQKQGIKSSLWPGGAGNCQGLSASMPIAATS